MKKQVKVLIAEDDANVSLALGIVLRRAISGIEITTVSDGQAALAQIREDGYDLVISDWNMPRVSGLELLTMIRSNSTTRWLPFLMLTARADAGSFGDLFNDKATDYLGKPFDNDVFIEKVVTLLSAELSKD